MDKRKVKNYDFKKNRSMILHRGYCADCYYFEYKNERKIIKIFDNQESAKLEYEAILKLKEIRSDNIVCPEILDFSQNIITMRFEKGLSFYEFLRNSNNLEKSAKLFFEFGKFLASLHNKNRVLINNENGRSSLIHGDLNSKNFLFLNDDRLFIIDPKGEVGDVYDDISEFILNFYPFNFTYEIFLSNKKKHLIESFLNGYVSISDIKITDSDINTNITKILETGEAYLSREIWYRFKKFAINIYIKYLIRRIKNGRIQIKLHG